MPWQDPEYLRRLNAAVQAELQSGTSPDTVMQMLQDNPQFQQLPSAQQSIEGLAAAADTPARPSTLMQAHRQALGLRQQGAPPEQIQEFVREQTGGQTDDWRVLRDMATGGNVAARADAAVQERQTEPGEDRPGLLRRVFDHIQPEEGTVAGPGIGDLGEQMIRGIPFVGEAAAQASRVPDALAHGVRSLRDPEVTFGEAFRGSMDESREQAQEFASENPVQSFAAQMSGSFGAGGFGLKMLQHVPTVSGAARFLTGRRPLPQAGRERLGASSAERAARKEQVRNLGTQSSSISAVLARAGRDNLGHMTQATLRAAVAGGAEGYLQNVGAAESWDDFLDRLGDPVPAAIGGGIGGFIGGTVGVATTGVDAARTISAIRATSTERTARTLERNLSNLETAIPSQMREARDQAADQVRREIIRPLEELPSIQGEESINRVLRSHPLVRERVSRARVNRKSGPNEIVWDDFQRARHSIGEDMKTATGNVSEYREAISAINDALEQVPDIGQMDQQFRQAYMEAVRPLDAFTAGRRVSATDSPDAIREEGRELFTVAGEVIPEFEEFYRLGIVRRTVEDLRNKGLPDLTAQQENQLRYALTGHPPPQPGTPAAEQADLALELIAREASSRNMDAAWENVLKFSSFMVLGSSVLAGAATASIFGGG